MITELHGCPLRRCDALLSTEKALVKATAA
jgi:hypothetical protein